MPQNNLTHDLDGGAGSQGVRRGVSSQIMWSHLYAYAVARPLDHVPGGSVLDRKNSTVGVESILSNVILKALGNLLRDENHLFSLPLLGLSRVSF